MNNQFAKVEQIQSWPSDVMVAIPSYKSAESLNQFLPELLVFVPENNVVIIDDASGDDTEAVCKKHRISYLKHDINMGKGAALVTGFTNAINHKAKWIISMDADGQHSPSDIVKFLKSSNDNPDAGIIIGARKMKPGFMPPARIFSNTVTSAVLSLLTKKRIRDCQSGFRMYSARILQSISLRYQRFEMESEVILRAAHAGFDISFIDVQTLYCSKQSHISHIKDTFRWIRAVSSVYFELYKNKLRSV